MPRRGFQFVVLVGLVAVAPLAVYGRGSGVKAGIGRVHAGIDFDLTWDSNPGYSPSGSQVSDLILRLRPNLDVSFPTDFIAARLKTKLGYDFFLGVENSETTNLSSFSGDADLDIAINPNGPVTFAISDHFARTADPRYTSLSERFDRLNNEARARLRWSPGSGALDFGLAYGLFIDLFQNGPASSGNGKAYSSYGHRLYFDAKWKFLPKTAAALDFEGDLRRYPDSFSDGSATPDSNAIRIMLGLIGQITPTISINLRAGYGDSLLTGGRTDTGQPYSGDGFRSALVQADATWQPATTMLQGGYTRSFQPVLLFGYYGQDRLFFRARQQLFGRLSLSGEVGFDFLTYGDPLYSGGSGGRSDKLLDVGLSGDYFVVDWLAVGFRYTYRALFTDFRDALNIDLSYAKHVVTLHIGIEY